MACGSTSLTRRRNSAAGKRSRWRLTSDQPRHASTPENMGTTVSTHRRMASSSSVAERAASEDAWLPNS
eukprot:scaffold147818_cov27-Tisochrysis_lutea.AAC.5